MNKSLSKTIVATTNVTTKLRNTLLKIRYEVNKKSYIKATISNEIICVSFLWRSKRDYYNNLNEKNICDNRKFWKVVRPLLSNSIVSNEKIIVEGEKITKTDQANGKVFNNFFSSII